MSNSNSNQPVVSSAREALNKFKMEAAADLRVPVPS
ncbi:small, acid-soluble spore protein, alpha/beta type [uncultured Flavonifractor sp.]|nr:small, acid-soluble spore protein, alpha/beta type [uncultured Flavonifractor sp.]